MIINHHAGKLASLYKASFLHTLHEVDLNTDGGSSAAYYHLKLLSFSSLDPSHPFYYEPLPESLHGEHSSRGVSLTFVDIRTYPTETTVILAITRTLGQHGRSATGQSGQIEVFW